ncbi:M23 family metallopeptidase [Bradyrhizobium sp. 83012]|uniref:M23 family metallopeptidase n=1 Tax=Bradyrhizobium aeschynomenes TaxID=2734909 RepID=A0ABX2CH31_9BRAD|nr:M23 family metallopeptidase [Bradyrhizobium aeschynomenes]NPU67521.1 M23 family metallopeptidase [Bradyrhizobium aeschynomenes]
MPRYEYPGYGPVGDGWLTKRPGTKGGYHGGTDNPAKPDTPVYAEYAGKVFRSGVIAGYGRAVVVESVAPDGTKFYALYGHLGPGDLPAPNTPIVAGRPIPGAVIGTKDYVQSMGGLSTGPHLHREIISGNVRLNADGPFGIYSSDVKHKADPDTFDINQPLFPYERPSQPSPPQPSDEVSKRLPGRGRIMSPPIAPSVSSPIVPGMPIPGAEGPTSVGGQMDRSRWCHLLCLDRCRKILGGTAFWDRWILFLGRRLTPLYSRVRPSIRKLIREPWATWLCCFRLPRWRTRNG